MNEQDSKPSNIHQLPSGGPTVFQKVALQCAINAKLAMCGLQGRGYVTAVDAGDIFAMAKILTATLAVGQGMNGQSADLSSPQTLGSTSEVAGMAAVAEALERVGQGA